MIESVSQIDRKSDLAAAFHYSLNRWEALCRYTAYSAQSERRFHAIVNARRVSAAAAADIGSSVHEDIVDGRIPAMTCSDSRPLTPMVTAAA